MIMIKDLPKVVEFDRLFDHQLFLFHERFAGAEEVFAEKTARLESEYETARLNICTTSHYNGILLSIPAWLTFFNDGETHSRIIDNCRHHFTRLNDDVWVCKSDGVIDGYYIMENGTVDYQYGSEVPMNVVLEGGIEYL